MADEQLDPPGSQAKWLWIVVVAVLAIVLLLVFLNPTTGQEEARLEAAVEEAEIDRDDTLSDFPPAAEPANEDGTEAEMEAVPSAGDAEPLAAE